MAADRQAVDYECGKINVPASTKTPQQISLKFGINLFDVRVVLPQFWFWSSVRFRRKNEK